MKRIVLMAMFALSAFGLAYAAPKKETPAGTGSSAGGAIGTAANPVKVRYLNKDNDPVTDKLLPLLEAGIEKSMAAQGKYIDLEILSPPTGSYATAVPIAFRTGQIVPDIIYFQGGDLPIAQEGMLTDLTPYVNGSRNVQAIMEAHNKAAMANYPYLIWLSPPRIATPVIREDWYNKLRSAQTVMQNPSIDNYYAMFKEMKDTGLCRWPITTDGTITKLDTVFNHAFGVTATLMKQNGKWVYSQATPQNRAKIEFYARLYKDGLLDNEYVTKAWDTMEQAFYEGTAGFVTGTAGAVIDVYDNKMFSTQGSHLVVLPPARGTAQAYLSLDVSKESRGFAIAADSKVKDAAWAFLDFMASPQGRIFDKLGVEGVHYNLANGKYALTPEYSSWYARCFETFNGLDTSNVAGELRTKAGAESLDLVTKYFAPDTNVILPDELLPLKDAMDKLYTEYSTDIIRGVRPISDYDEFISKWNAAGGTRISEYLAAVLK
jgi:putative aldouronate transport system substrate-binding protein